MITDFISGFEFETAGIQCLCQSINTLFQVYDSSSEVLQDEVVGTEVSMDDVWEHNFVAVNTSFILVHQGLEALLKWKVSQASPLLLLDQAKSDWPTLPLSKSVSFSELHHIGGVNLIHTFFAVNQNAELKKPAFYEFLEEIRKTRNEIIHVRPNSALKVSDCLKYTLRILTEFYGSDKWLRLLRDQHLKNPLLGYSDYDLEAALFIRTLDFLITTLGKGEMNKYLSFDIKSRAYCCPRCTYNLYTAGYESDETKMAHLIPNDPKSLHIECMICGHQYDVKRENCILEDCKGNVICDDVDYESYCLTCFEIN